VISAGGGDSGPAFSTDVSFKGGCTNSRGRGFERKEVESLSLEECFKKCTDLETAGEDVEVRPSFVTIESPKVTGISYKPQNGVKLPFCACEIDTGRGPVTGGSKNGGECYPNQVRPSLILQHLILIICCPSSYCLDCRIELWFVYSVHFCRCVQRQN